MGTTVASSVTDSSVDCLQGLVWLWRRHLAIVWAIVNNVGTSVGHRVYYLWHYLRVLNHDDSEYTSNQLYLLDTVADAANSTGVKMC